MLRVASALSGAMLLFTACTATHIVRPLPSGTSAWTASLGGPYLPGSVPTQVLPYLTIGWQHGVSDDLTLGGAVHGTMAAFGIAAGEVTAARRFASQQGARPEFVGTAATYLFAGRGGARVYPSLGAVASWTLGPRTLLYGGGNALAQFNGAPATLVNPLLGVQRSTSWRFAWQAEVKWMAANADTRAGVFEGVSSVNHRGAIALQLGATMRRKAGR